MPPEAYAARHFAAARPATALDGETGYNACRRESVKTFIRGTPRSDLS
jgi:hypothetical protein